MGQRRAGVFVLVDVVLMQMCERTDVRNDDLRLHSQTTTCRTEFIQSLHEPCTWGIMQSHLTAELARSI